MCERLKNCLFMFPNTLLSQVLSFLQDAPPCELRNVAQQTPMGLPFRNYLDPGNQVTVFRIILLPGRYKQQVYLRLYNGNFGKLIFLVTCREFSISSVTNQNKTYK